MRIRRFDIYANYDPFDNCCVKELIEDNQGLYVLFEDHQKIVNELEAKSRNELYINLNYKDKMNITQVTTYQIEDGEDRFFFKKCEDGKLCISSNPEFIVEDGEQYYQGGDIITISIPQLEAILAKVKE